MIAYRTKGDRVNERLQSYGTSVHCRPVPGFESL